MSAPEDQICSRAPRRLGTVLCGKYRLDRLIGVGGMASVFAATHLRNANRVAVKILHREYAANATQRARFLGEGYAANSVDHPGAVRVLDDDTAEDGALFLVMELLDGESLDARWERCDRHLEVAEVVAVLRELLDVLAAAHEKGIVHRDIKPDNLFLTRDGRVKVLDFGIARMQERLQEATRATTGSGELFGTPAFMPPEQALGRRSDVDGVSDVWAAGATAFSLLSGRFVHEAETPEELRVLAATRRAPPLASAAPQVPAPIARVIDQALAFEKRDRWPNARAMLDALTLAQQEVHLEPQAIVAGEHDNELARLGGLPTVPIESAIVRLPSPDGARRTRRRRVVIVAAGAIACFAVGAVLVGRSTAHRSPPIPPPRAVATADDPLAP